MNEAVENIRLDVGQNIGTAVIHPPIGRAASPVRKILIVVTLAERLGQKTGRLALPVMRIQPVRHLRNAQQSVRLAGKHIRQSLGAAGSPEVPVGNDVFSVGAFDTGIVHAGKLADEISNVLSRSRVCRDHTVNIADLAAGGIDLEPCPIGSDQGRDAEISTVTALEFFRGCFAGKAARGGYDRFHQRARQRQRRSGHARVNRAKLAEESALKHPGFDVSAADLPPWADNLRLRGNHHFRLGRQQFFNIDSGGFARWIVTAGFAQFPQLRPVIALAGIMMAGEGNCAGGLLNQDGGLVGVLRMKRADRKDPAATAFPRLRLAEFRTIPPNPVVEIEIAVYACRGGLPTLVDR
ncbi:hypothetical protein SDC9_88095 [bioreactor metagenome]|uniref:Uncharacterized protein n=1 Tax=bioreactor metagenome TaxID=1076179 RepID=A0A644ZKM8_9ZZZZ